MHGREARRLQGRRPRRRPARPPARHEQREGRRRGPTSTRRGRDGRARRMGILDAEGPPNRAFSSTQPASANDQFGRTDLRPPGTYGPQARTGVPGADMAETWRSGSRCARASLRTTARCLPRLGEAGPAGNPPSRGPESGRGAGAGGPVHAGRRLWEPGGRSASGPRASASVGGISLARRCRNPCQVIYTSPQLLNARRTVDGCSAPEWVGGGARTPSVELPVLKPGRMPRPWMMTPS